MSKQDRQGVRTATDLERKYGFGQSFAELYGLANDARSAAEAAQNAVSDLDSTLTADEIFNRLTVGGTRQGVFRDEEGNLYVNADYIGSGKVKAEYIDVENLTVKAANITGQLTADKIDTTNLQVNAGNIVGKLTVGMLPDGVATSDDIPSNVSELDNDIGYQTESGVVSIINGTVTADFLNALGVSATYLEGRYIYINDYYGHSIGYISTADASTAASKIILHSNYAMELSTEGGTIYVSNGGANFSFSASDLIVSCNAMYPSSALNNYLGTSTNPWGAVYSADGLIQKSDRNLKNSIEELPEKYLSMFDNLSPVRFKLNDGTSGRYHVGFIAQDVEDAMTASGIDSLEFAGFVKDKDADGNDIYMLRYGEFIGVLTAKIKELETKIKAMGA